MNIYIIGDIRGAYRVEQLVKKLIENRNYHVYVNDLRKTVFWGKICKKITDFFAIILSDIVYVSPCQHTNKLLKIAVLFKKKIITDFYISFYDTEVLDRRKCKENSKKAKKWKKIDSYALDHSTKLIFLNQNEGRYYTKILGCDLNKLNYSIIPLCIPEKPKAVLPYFTQKRAYIHFCWCGTYIPLQALDKIIKASELAIKNGLNMHLTIWGDSEIKAKPYRQLVTDLNMTQQVTFVNDKWNNIDEWINFIVNECDVTLGIFGDSEKAKTVLANKVLDGVAFHTPVLTAESLGLREFFSDYDMFITNNHRNEIAEAMIKISKTEYTDIVSMTDSAYKIYRKIFTPDIFGKNICKCIHDCMMEKK